MSTALPSVSISEGRQADGTFSFIVKLQSNDCELNVWVTPDDLDALRGVGSATWTNGSSQRVGECLGAPAFWSCEDGCLAVLAGSDDETWDVGVFLDERVVVELIAEIDRVQGKLSEQQ